MKHPSKLAALFIGALLYGQTLIQQNYDARAYNFRVTSGSGVTANLAAAGAGKVITFSICPKGLRVGNTLRISGGTGTDEAAAITATTCPIGGARLGTATVTTANTHTGSYLVSSSTAGIGEAVAAAFVAGGSAVAVPTGTYDLYAAVNVPGPVMITGAGYGLSGLSAHSATQDMFVVTYAGSASTVIIRDLYFGTSVTKTAGAAIKLVGTGPNFQTFAEISDCWFLGQFISVDAYDAAYYRIHDNQFQAGAVNGIYIWQRNPDVPDAGDSRISDNQFYGGIVGLTGIKYESGAGMRILSNKFLQVQKAIDATLAAIAGSGQLIVANNTFDGGGGIDYGLLLGCVAGGTTVFADIVISGNFFAGGVTDSLLHLQPNGSVLTRIQITGNVFTVMSATGNGVYLESGGAYTLVGNTLTTGTASQAALKIGASVVGSAIGNAFYTFANSGFSINPTSLFVIKSNAGIDDVQAAIGGSSTLTLPLNPTILYIGNNTVTSVVPPLATPGQTWLISAQGTSTFTAGSTIGNSGTMSPNKLYTAVWLAGKLWIQGPGF